MKTIYLSYPYDRHTPSYGDDDRFTMNKVNDMSKNSPNNKCQFTMTNHIGTHVDGPLHFDPAGRPIHSYPPEFWMTDKVDVLRMPSDARQLKDHGFLLPFDLGIVPDADTEALIVQTGYGSLRHTESYWMENPGLHPDWADVLRNHCPGLRFILIDSVSISSWQNRPAGRRAHREFLSSEKGSILLVEDADLSGIEYLGSIRELYIFPLLIEGADSAPVTVIAKGS